MYVCEPRSSWMGRMFCTHVCVSKPDFLGKGDTISQRFSKIEFWPVLTGFDSLFQFSRCSAKLGPTLGGDQRSDNKVLASFQSCNGFLLDCCC
jgi:hypothetical protein